MNLARLEHRRGFTLLELLAVIATIAILASLLLPVLTKAKVRAHRTQCLSNLHQLGFAWEMYHSDNNGRLAESYPVNNPNVWVQGDMTKAADAVNLDLIREGKLFPYAPTVSQYRCPTDRGTLIDNRRVATVRSYSMNGFMGARDVALGPIPSTAADYVLFYAKDSEIPRPSQLWVLLDEDERSINDGFFITDPNGRLWVDFPAISSHRHGYSFSLNFADGHSEVWRCQDSRSLLVKQNKTEQSGNIDLARLARATATKR